MSKQAAHRAVMKMSRKREVTLIKTSRDAKKLLKDKIEIFVPGDLVTFSGRLFDPSHGKVEIIDNVSKTVVKLPVKSLGLILEEYELYQAADPGMKMYWVLFGSTRVMLVGTRLKRVIPGTDLNT